MLNSRSRRCEDKEYISEPPAVREIRWRPEPPNFGIKEHPIDLLGETFHSQGGLLRQTTWEQLSILGEQPIVYVWLDHFTDPNPEHPNLPLILYVGQTIHLERRTREHMARIERGSLGRELTILRLQKNQARAHFWSIAWRTYPCDCALDHEEARLIALLRPRFNVSPGNLGRGPECDTLCLRPR